MLINKVQRVVDVLHQVGAVGFKEGAQVVGQRIDRVIDDQPLGVISPGRCVKRQEHGEARGE